MKSIILFFLLFIQFSCVRILPDEELTMTRTPYYGNDFRLDGYYSKFRSTYNTYSNLIFYRNGVMMSFDYSSRIEDFFNNNKYIESVRNDKSSWGVYVVRNDSVIVQNWYLNPNYVIQYLISSYQLKIKNDTTLSFADVDYHFKHFSPKPDSTNVFIK